MIAFVSRLFLRMWSTKTIRPPKLSPMADDAINTRDGVGGLGSPVYIYGLYKFTKSVRIHSNSPCLSVGILVFHLSFFSWHSVNFIYFLQLTFLKIYFKTCLNNEIIDFNNYRGIG